MMFPQEKANNYLTMSIKVKFNHYNIKYIRHILNRNCINFTDDWNDFFCKGSVYREQHCIPAPESL